MRHVSFAFIVIAVSMSWGFGCGQAVPVDAVGSSRQAAAGDNFCGGIAGIPCPEGQICKLDGDFPDAGGHCIGANFECVTDKDCFHTGCSGQICANQDIITTCEFKCEYGCYANAGCGCVGGKCQFARDQALGQCIAACNQPAPTGEPCGSVTCGAGLVCCNASCGICTEPGGFCIQIVCD
jgi:eight-cysteine-cluster-containing protein